ncbi:MAG TPA: MaoC/PaaZ C-terminal domain-containing protein [Acidimicrobiia bacterium]|nr:MaoC/PaaZ C-terminal domain-containing protein [Acidimicrobiia bacterium]
MGSPLFFDDISVGLVLRSDKPYVVTAGEIVEVAERWDPQPFHLSEAAGAASQFGGLVASGLHTIAASLRLGFDAEPVTADRAGLGMDELRFIRPVRPDDELVMATEIIELRPSVSRPDRGIVRGRREVRNQAGEVVLTYLLTWMVERHPPGEG